jgi:serine protease Do
MVLVEPMEKYVGEEKAFRSWGISVQGITGPMAFSRGYPDTKGVVLTSLRPGSAPDSAKPALEPGDVVIEIAGQPVADLAAFERLAKEHEKGSAVPVRYRRGKRDMVTVLDFTPKPRRRGSGEIAKAWLGVGAQVLTPEVAKALRLEGRKGFRVTWVMPGTEAEKAGLRVGDVLLAVDGEALEATSVQDAEILKRRIEDMSIGDDAVLSILRDGAAMDVTVTLEATPDSPRDVKTAEDELLEYKVRELVYDDRVERDLGLDFRGVIVSDVDLGGWAGVAGLLTGDVVLTIQGQAIPDTEAFKKVVARIAEDRPRRIQIFVRRDRTTAFVFVQPDWPR